MSFISTKTSKETSLVVSRQVLWHCHLHLPSVFKRLVASTTHRQVRWAHWLALWVQHFWAASPQYSVAHIHKSAALRVQ